MEAMSTVEPQVEAVQEAMRFLVVHESAMMRRLIRRVLTEQGFDDCVEAKDGEEAVRAAERERFDGVITDWYLEGLSGTSFIQAVRSRPGYRRLPVVLVTSNGLPEEIRRGILPLVTDYLAVPFTLEALQQTIDNVTRSAVQYDWSR